MNTKEYPILDPVATGKKIKQLRKEHHLRVGDIAEYMGFESQQAIFKWQRGDSLPSVDNLFALSRLFGIPIDDILIGKGEGRDSSPGDDDVKAEGLINYVINSLLWTSPQYIPAVYLQ